MSIYQPMDTAPKDGTEFILNHKQFGEVTAKLGQEKIWSAGSTYGGRKLKEKVLGVRDVWKVWNWQGFGERFFNVDMGSAFTGWRKF